METDRHLPAARHGPILLAVAALLIGLGPAAAGPAQAIPAEPTTERVAARAAVDDSSGAPLAVSPTPQRIDAEGEAVVLGRRVRVVAGDDTDPAARRLLTDVLRAHGVRPVEPAVDRAGALPTLHLGPADRPDVAAALDDVEVPTVAEGYALRADLDTVALGGVDPAGQYYAVQTFRQLLTGRAPARVAGVRISDHPSMRLRGAIEGFYGSPWTHRERLDQLSFYGDVKANTYVYAPKDDPYHRDRWREPYPADQLAELTELVEQATDHHVRFTFALSPGTSICYSDPDDRSALVTKLDAMYDIGVRSFSIPLDDISYTRWNCAADEQAYGAPGQEAAARAQVDLLNDVQQTYLNARAGSRPLQMVPTEYGDLRDTPYKQIIRGELDPRVEVMWTGTDVVPPQITVEQAEQAAGLFGRNVFVWDNYPVNDYPQTAGRLLLAPYDHREPGLSDHLSGIVSNPMNQAAASKVAVFTMADFAWNDRGYDRDLSWVRAASYLAGGDRAGVAALLVFFDLNHRAPTFGSDSWQPQAPELAGRIERFWAVYDDGDADERAEARWRLSRYFARIENAPVVIRAVVSDRGFLDDAANWLDATELWGAALLAGGRVLRAIDADRPDVAADARAELERLVEAAGEIRSVPGENRNEGPVQIGDGVVDAFLTEVVARHDEYLGLPRLRNVSDGREATQISDWSDDYGAANSVDGDLWNFSTTSGAEPQPWWQVDLGSSTSLERIDVYNRSDCCADRVRDYYVLVSERPFSGSLAEALADPDVFAHHEIAQAGRPTGIELTDEPGGSQVAGRYVRVWLATEQPQELNMAEVKVFGR